MFIFILRNLYIMQRLLPVLIAIVLMLGCGSKEKTKNSVAKASSMVEEKPTTEQFSFPIYDFNGLEPLLHKDDDKTYIINFWATWCKPCVAELPYFEKVNAEMDPQKVKVILVSLDMPRMWKTHLEPFIETKNIRSQVVVLDDPKQNTWIPKIDKEWSGAIPATLIYHKNKRSFFEKSFTFEELKKTIEEF